MAVFKAPTSRLLAGPILRRCEPKGISVWVATLGKGKLELIVRSLRTSQDLGRGTAEVLKVGRGPLHVGLVTAVPADSAGFPLDEILLYRLRIDGQFFYDLDRTQAFGYLPRNLYPSFVLRKDGRVNILHGSCRKLHGEGEDALALADKILRSSASDPRARPSALYLTGDQIYADDVSDAISVHLRALAPFLVGDEDVPFPGAKDGIRKVASIGDEDRRNALKGVFTSTEADRHLIGFGEFAAMYLLNWGTACWPDNVTPKQSTTAQATAMRTTMEQVRRVLANIPSYMMFDDHEVTDDWNLTSDWVFRATHNPLTRRIIENALAAFVLFQAWGNAPAELADLAPKIADSAGQNGYKEEVLAAFGRSFAFLTPPHPVSLFIDSRTQRDLAVRPGVSAGLLSKAERQALASKLKKLTRPPIVIAPAPFIGLPTVDSLQAIYSAAKGPEGFDFESWAANPAAYYAVKMHFLLNFDDPKPTLLLLSGDVHYSYAVCEKFTDVTTKREIRFLQFTSSALKNETKALTRLSKYPGDRSLRELLVPKAEDRDVFANVEIEPIVEKLRKTYPKSLGDTMIDARWTYRYVEALERIRRSALSGAPVSLKRARGSPAPQVKGLLYTESLTANRDDQGEPPVYFENGLGQLEIDGKDVVLTFHQTGKGGKRKVKYTLD